MKNPYRSLFWPVVLIGVGLLWLLANFGWLPTVSLSYLLRFWPIILIVIGLDMLVGRRSALFGAVIGMGAVALIALGLVFGQSLGMPAAQEGKTEQFQAFVGQATAAKINLGFSVQPVQVRALPAGSDQLVDASIGHYGEIDFEVSGEGSKSVSLRQRDFSLGDLSWIGVGDNLRWEIGLNPKLPLNLRIDASTGSSSLDLSGLNLTGFMLDASTGSCELTLPGSAAGYEGSIKASTGSLRVALPAGANLTLHVDGSTGSLNFALPAGSALRVEVRDGGTGSVNLPASLTRLSGSDKEGVWESSGYAQAAAKITLIFDDLSTGSLNIR